MLLCRPKTKTSQRFYLMPEEYILMLQEHIKTNELKEDDFIFFSRKSKSDPIPLQTFRTHANNYCRIISPNFHFHQLRKSAVTHLHDKNISLEDIKNFVGHSNSKITEEVYLQRSNEKQAAILKILDETIQDLK